MKKSIASGILYGYFLVIAWGQIPSDGLLAYYPFNGDAWDASGNGHHGTVYGATPVTDRFGKPGAALYFLNSRVEIPDSTTLRPYNFTCSFWFNADGIHAPVFLCKPRGPGQEPTFGVWLRANTIQTYVTRPQQETYLASPLWIPIPGKWYHLAVSANYATREFTLWVDGLRFYEVTLNVALQYGPWPWIVGALQVDSSFLQYFFGKMDDLRLYNRALREKEIRALASEQPGGQPTPDDWATQPPPAGKYVIVQSENNGIPNRRARQIELTGLPPLWQRPWFVLTCLILLFSFSFLTLRLRHRQRERLRRLELEKWKALEAERGRIARDLHDDLGSGLSAISLLSEVARQKSEGGPVDEEIRQLAAASHTLSVRIREIIWMVSARNDRLDYLVSYLSNYVVEQFEHSPVELNLRLPESLPSTLVGGEQRRALFHAVKEALRLVAAQPGVKLLEFSFHLNDAFEVRLAWTGGAFSLKNNPQTALFQQLVKKWRETGGRFSGSDGPPVEWRFGMNLR